MSLSIIARTVVLTAAFALVAGFATPAQAAWQPQPAFRLSDLILSWLRPTSAKTPEIKPATPTPSPTAQNDSPMASLLQPKVNEAFVQQAQAEEKKIVAGWLTSWDEESFLSFKNNLDVITEVHPFAYTIGADGVSIVPDPGNWHKDEVMQLAKERGIKVIPTISGDVNYSDLMLNDPARRAAHIRETIRVIEENGYDGWDIDYEGFLNGYNRDVYATFMEDLAKELHARDKTVAIAIEAFNRQQDWDRIGKVVDRFMIMGYDYNSASGPTVGPIGPASWLREVVDYSATRVPKEKIVLGLGTYGYSWIHNGARYVSEAVGHDDALAIARDTGATIQRGQDDTPFFTYNRGLGQRHLYFEDALSTRPKLDVVNDTGIGGIAFWRLGTEDPQIWNEVKNKLQ